MLKILIFLLVAGQAFGQLKKADVRVTMEAMFGYHVEHKEFTPLIAKRAVKLYFEQFDPEKLYVLNSQIAPFLECPKEFLEDLVAQYKRDDLSFYLTLNGFLQNAVARGRDYREELERELILNPPDFHDYKGVSYLNYSGSENELKQRIRKQLATFLLNEKNGVWTPKQREKIFALLEKRLRRVEDTYVLQDRQGRLRKEGEHCLVLHMLKAMAKSLDSHTAYFSPDEAFEMRANLEKQFEGIGIVLKEGVDGVIITDLIKGGPAYRSQKVKIGDQLVAIDGKFLENVPYEKILHLLKSEGKEGIELGLKRGNIDLSVQLMKEKILMQNDRLQYSAEPFADGIIGKIFLSSFYDAGDSNCEKDMKEAIKNLKMQGKLYGLVLDLRENSGGFLNQAVKVAGLFITNGVIVISKYSKGEVQYLRTIDGRSYFNGPLIVLTSKASASAAEIVAQALQDYGAALITGDERTYGKGTIQYQTVTDPSAKAYFKVTVGKYYTVSGKSTQIEGVKADIYVPTQYSKYNIGERFLEYPLLNDQMPPAFVDPLSDIDDQSSKLWLQKNYLPQIQQKTNRLHALLPFLKINSAYRQANDKNYKVFLDSLKSKDSTKLNWGEADLQMEEAVHILKDIVFLSHL